MPKLSSAVIRGSTVYTPVELFKVYESRLGKPITPENARSLALSLAQKYERDGYATPQIQVDDALMSFGVLRIDVLEPRISRIDILGNPGPYRDALEKLGENITAEVPLRRRDLQAALRRMRELPGLSVAASTAPDADEPSAYELNLNTAYEPVSAALQITNRGSHQVGPNLLLGQVVANGLLPGRTKIGVLFGAAEDYDEYRGAGLLADKAIGRGSHLSLTGFRARAALAEAGLEEDLGYVRDIASLSFLKPVTESASSSVSFTAALELDDVFIDYIGYPLRDDRLRMLDVGGQWVHRAGASTEYAGSLNVVKGLDGLGSRLEALDLASDPRRRDFTLVKLSFTRLESFAPQWSVRVDAYAQQSADVLPYTQRFKIGGEQLGRGFPIPEIAGDRGAGAKAELRRRLPAMPAPLRQASVYTFYDLGAAWQNDVPGRQSAATAGLGFAIDSRKTSAYVELAEPLTLPAALPQDGPSVFFELTKSF
ncbi:MAG TPA: ShlB/FhaC/HecB family hemolysin secretion/activation protein [Gammaproteobacteria bacterium]|nr:ShlB/FhaC/HecB family hemolysin secretion/activation protein [Gammaproteobacteria bacterium]